MKEADLQAQVIDMARLCGWLVHHTRPALNERGEWRTPIQGDPGYPDLTLVHERSGRVLFAELKSERGRLTDPQKRWGAALGGLWRLWRPSDWPEIEATLRQRDQGHADSGR